MSDIDSRDTENGDDVDEQDNICRDFLRNVCRRGKRCKYRHPEAGEAKEMGRKIEYIFCHDFQNKECRRSNCKFIHCSRSDEDYYHSTGELPQRVLDSMNMGPSSHNEGSMDMDVPVCKDHLKGECHRGGRCKFRHINAQPDFDQDMGGRRRGGGEPPFGMYNNYDNFEYYEPPERKRRLYGDYGNNVPPLRQPPPPPMPADYYILEEENAFLRRKLDDLRKQVGDLTATNEFLLEQNAQLRLGSTKLVKPNMWSM